MYYTFYMNEQLALDNWDYYNECNWLLTNFLVKNEEMTINDKVSFYFEHRNVREENEIDYLRDNEIFQEAYEEYMDKKYLYESYLEEPDDEHLCYVGFEMNALFENYSKMTEWTDKRTVMDKFRNKESRNRKIGCKLRKIDEVIIYKSDIEYIERAKQEHGLTVRQVKLLFGMIFFSRMNNVKWCRIGTEYKLKSFLSCFDETIKMEDMYDIHGTFHLMELDEDGCFMKGIEMNRTWREYLHIEDELDYIYPNFDNKDEVAYVFKTTKENNRLNLSELAEQILPNIKEKYCIDCGTEFTPNSNRQCRCEKCAKEHKKMQAKLRKRKQRNKNVTL